MFSLLGNNTVIMYILILFTFYFMNLCVYVCSLNYMVLLQFLCGVVSKFFFFFVKENPEGTDIDIKTNGMSKKKYKY